MSSLVKFGTQFDKFAKDFCPTWSWKIS